MVKGLKNGKACGVDSITNDMLKSGIDVIMETPPPKMFNTILEIGSFPKNLNCFILTPIFKNGDKNDPTNYRGIAVSSAVSKTFLRILTEQINGHMQDSNHWYLYRKLSFMIQIL